MALSHGPRIVTDGLVLCLDAANVKSYPGSGTTWTDLSGYGNNGTLTNGPTYSSSNGGSIVFDGSNKYIDLGNILNVGTGQFTIETIAKTNVTSINYSKVASKGDYTRGGWRLYFGKNPSNNEYGINFQYGDGTTGDINLGIKNNISTNTWYHIVVSKDSNNLLLGYINAELGTDSLTTTFDFTTNSYNYIIGKASNEYFNGNVACYRHYNRALTANEVSQNFNALRGRFNI